MILRRSLRLALGIALAASAAVARPAGAAEGFCADELVPLEGDVCWAGVARKEGEPRTLVIFLHGLLDDGAGWQLAMQRGMVSAGRRLGFSVLAPRGRNGVGPGRRPDQIGWPTSEALREEHEGPLLEKIGRARREAERREGAPYDEVFVLGFSNGAYYAASLAMRDRLPDVDGYAVIAGGSAATRPTAERGARKPVFVGVASKDRTTVAKGRELVRALARWGWPHRAVEAPVGHTVADSHLSLGLAWLRGRARGETQRGASEKGPSEKGPSGSGPPPRPRPAKRPAPRAGSRAPR